MFGYADMPASVIAAAISVSVIFVDSYEPKVLFSVVNFV